MPKSKLTQSELVARKRAECVRSEQRLAATLNPAIKTLQSIHKQLVKLEYNAIADQIQTEITLAVRATLHTEKTELAEETGEPTMFDDDDGGVR